MMLAFDCMSQRDLREISFAITHSATRGDRFKCILKIRMSLNARVNTFIFSAFDSKPIRANVTVADSSITCKYLFNLANAH